MNRLIILAVAAAIIPTACIAAEDVPVLAGRDLELYGLVQELEGILPATWRVIESDTGRIPIGWTGPENGLYAMIEDNSTRFFHPSGFHYYSFYRVWLLPSSWEGEMRHTPYVSDSAPAFLLGRNDRYVVLYHTAGGNVWEEGPSELCHILDLDSICYTDLTRRVVDLEIEEQLTEERDSEAAFEMNPYRIVGLAGEGPSIYMEYVFADEEDPNDAMLADLTDRLAGSVFDRFPEVESLYLRRCASDTFTDTIVNRD